MKKFAANFAKKLKGGEILALVGELGAGKTTFTQGLAIGLKIKGKITSPTFVIMNEYPVAPRKRAGNYKLKILNFKLLHLDAYRLKDEKDLSALGVAELLNDPNNIVVIEWADKIKKFLKKYHVIWLEFKIKGAGRGVVIK